MESKQAYTCIDKTLRLNQATNKLKPANIAYTVSGLILVLYRLKYNSPRRNVSLPYFPPQNAIVALKSSTDSLLRKTETINHARKSTRFSLQEALGQHESFANKGFCK